MRISTLLISASLLALAACDPYPPTMTPDYSIRVMPSQNGMVAIPPNCPSWSADTKDNYDNQPDPQFGCATARNLALTVERPEDLVQPKPMGDTRGVVMVGAIRRYDNNQTRGLIYTSDTDDATMDATTAPTGSSQLTGDVTGSGGGSSGGSSSSAAGGSTSAGP
jgi:Pilus biogenesis CpaD protein (pilus_cpaD)